MSDTPVISSATSASRHGIVLDDTPEWSVQESLTEVSRELEGFRSQMREGDPAAAQRAIDRAERRLPAAPAAAAAAPLRAAVAELRGFLAPNADAAAAEVSAVRQNTARRAPSLASAVGAFSRSGSTRPLMSHFGATPRAAMRRLASVDASELKTELVAAGATREQATEMIDQLGSTAATRFHRMAVGQARMQVREAVNDFRDIARGQGLNELSTRLVGGEGRPLLDQMRASDIDMVGIDAALASNDAEALGAELAPALRQLSNKLMELRTDIGLSSDLSGALYVNFPGAAAVVAESAGMDPSIALGQSDGSVLGNAVAEHAREANHAQEGARTWLSATLGVTAFLGGLVAPIAIAGAIAEANTTNKNGERTNLAATAGLATAARASDAAERAEHSTRDAVIASGVAVVSEGIAHSVGHGAAHALEHRLGEQLANAVGHAVHGVVEQLVHQGAHAVEHQVLHDEGH